MRLALLQQPVTSSRLRAALHRLNVVLVSSALEQPTLLRSIVVLDTTVLARQMADEQLVLSATIVLVLPTPHQLSAVLVTTVLQLV
jgi:hypothetical protein